MIHIASHRGAKARCRRRLSALACTAVAAIAAGALATPARAIELRAVALVGDGAPGTATVFQGFTAPVLNNSGSVAFDGLTGPVGGPYIRGIFSEGDGVGDLRKVALVGETAPGTGGKLFTEFEQSDRNLYLNNLGDVAFKARVTGALIGLWTDRERPTNALTKIMVEGDPAPGAAGDRSFQFGPGFLAMGGIHSGTAFYSILTVSPTPPDNFPSSAVFSESFAVVLGKVAQTGYDNAPGSMTGGGTPVRFTEVLAPTINDAGHVAFSGKTAGGAVIGQAGIWTNSNDGILRKVALQGEAAPGTATIFSQLFRENPVINNNGDVVFMATLSGLIAGGLREGVWVERGGAVQKVAFESEAAPGTASTFSDMRDALIDGQGRAVFSSQLANGRDGLWRETAPGTLVKVAVEAEPAPGTEFNFLNIQDLAVNDGGQVAFKAQLSNSQTAVFATNPAGVVHKVLAQGDMVDVDGDTLEVAFLDFLGMNGGIAASGLANGFNDAGQVALVASFSPTELHPNGLFGVFVIQPPAADSADFDGDDDVDGEDFLAWQRGFGGTAADGGDANGDNMVDAEDLAVWTAQFGEPGPFAAAVPEPSSAALVLTGAVLLVRRRSVFFWCGPGCRLRLPG